MSTIPPGWYKDPADPTTQRWWDGEGWLGDPIPADATPPAGPPPVTAPVVAAPAGPPGGYSSAGQVTPPGPPWPASHRYPLVSPRPHGFLLASPGRRLAARLIDILVIALLAGVANFWFAQEFWRAFEPVWQWAETGRMDMTTVPTSALNRSVELLTRMLIVLTAVWFAYEVPASANSGQTLGKRLLGVRVVRLEADERLGFGRSFRRWFRLAWPTPFWVACSGLLALLQFIDCLFVATDRRLHQALHDRISHTVVVRVPRADRPETARTGGDETTAGAGATATTSGSPANPTDRI